MITSCCGLILVSHSYLMASAATVATSNVRMCVHTHPPTRTHTPTHTHIFGHTSYMLSNGQSDCNKSHNIIMQHATSYRPQCTYPHMYLPYVPLHVLLHEEVCHTPSMNSLQKGVGLMNQTQLCYCILNNIEVNEINNT